jgi:hypothetical protein
MWALTQFYVTNIYLCRKHGETVHMPLPFLTDRMVPYTSLLSVHLLTRINFELIFLNLSTRIDNYHYTQSGATVCTMQFVAGSRNYL